MKNTIQYKPLFSEAIKITTADENDYRAGKEHLNNIKEVTDDIPANANQQIEYHIYQLKSEKWYRFVIRGRIYNLFIKLVTPLEVAQEIDNNINPKKAPEINEISPGLLKELLKKACIMLT